MDTEHDRWGQSANPADMLAQLERRMDVRSADGQVYHNILDQIFTAIDAFRLERVEAWEIDEAELRHAITQAVRRIDALDVSPQA